MSPVSLAGLQASSQWRSDEFMPTNNDQLGIELIGDEIVPLSKYRNGSDCDCFGHQSCGAVIAASVSSGHSP